MANKIIKKKNDAELIGVQILEGVYIHYRHHHPRRRQPFLRSLLTAVSAGCLFLVLAVLSFLPPALINNHLITSSSDGGIKVEKARVFDVPIEGEISLGRELWTTSNDQTELFYGCSNASHNFITAETNTKPNRYLLIETSGGLNQQRTGITDAVVAAYILNATLVVPELDRQSFWNDTSNFSDIFDVDWFTAYLSKDVVIVKQVPESAGEIVTSHIPRNCNPKCYKSRVTPLFDKKHVVRLKRFDYRLSNWLVDEELQKLRCRVNYHALRFSSSIGEMGQKLVQRMRIQSKHFVALHLRYEADMLAFSGCYFGGGEKEKEELGELRNRWKTLPTMDPERERRHGKCPLSPEEVGLMLRALGFGPEVHIYVASGPIYGGEEALAPLKAIFPNLHSKETLSSKEEIAEFSSYSSRMAALDFVVSDESDVFVVNNNGNMAKILAGRRRYFGHKQTVRPNTKKLYALFLNRNNMTWQEFSSRVRKIQTGFVGNPNEVKSGMGGFHENPFSCICKKYETYPTSTTLQVSTIVKCDRNTSKISKKPNMQMEMV